MLEALAASPLEADLRSAWPAATQALEVRVVEGLRVLSLRHRAGGTAVVEQALEAHGIPALPEPGTFMGTEPRLVWTGAAESLLLTTQQVVADGVLRALSPACASLACAVDQSAGSLVLDLRGAALADVLSHLFDANAIPPHAGLAARARMIDISATLVRLEPGRAWLVVDRPLGLYVLQWIAEVLRAV